MWSEKQKNYKKFISLKLLLFLFRKVWNDLVTLSIVERKKVLLWCCVARSTLVSHLSAVPASSLPKMSHDYELMAMRGGALKNLTATRRRSRLLFVPRLFLSRIIMTNACSLRFGRRWWIFEGSVVLLAYKKTITFVYFWLISLFNINYSDITRCMSVQRFAKLSDYRATGFFCFFFKGKLMIR